MSDRAARPGAALGQPAWLRLPLLDRLLETRPVAADVTAASEVALNLLRRAVRRDLEAMLNTRRRRRRLPSGLDELPHSPLGYGVADATSGAYALPERREALAREVEAMIRRFEPRLAAISVSLCGGASELDRTLRLRVDAVLHVEPVAEPVSFETVVEVVTRDVAVRDI